MVTQGGVQDLAKHVHQLTELAVQRSKPGSVRREIPDGSGLYLIVHPTGAKSWAVRYRRDGKPRKLTIAGSYPAIDLKAARALARKALEAVAHGQDPAAAKLQARRVSADRTTDFELVAADFLVRYVKKKGKKKGQLPRPRYLEELGRHLGFRREEGGWAMRKGGLADRWKGRKVSSITKDDVIVLLDEQMAGGIGVNANRLRAALHLFFNWAKGRNKLVANPCAGIDPPAAETERTRVLTDNEMRLFWQASGEDRLFGPFWRILALTGQRRNEALGLTWGEIDEAAALWTIPGARTKNRLEHAVPVASLAMMILDAQPHVGGKRGLVFTTTGDGMLGGLSRAKKRLDARMLALAQEHDPKAEIPPWTLHDLRRTAATRMAKLGASVATVEKVLNHISGTFAGIVGVYQHHDFEKEKRAALDAWARHVQSLTSGTVNNVVPITKRRRP